MSYLFVFSYCSRGSGGKSTGVVCHSLMVDHVLSECSTVTHPSWVALHSMAHSFIELHKPLHHDKAVIHEGDTATSLNSFILNSFLVVI